MGIGMMAPWMVDAIGATGAVLTTLCWVPQAVKIVRERETRAISLPGTTLCTLGVLLWFVYGLAILDGPLIGSSIVTFAMTATILVLKIRHG
jgi:MtN3 and saliva related transmembrane protein